MNSPWKNISSLLLTLLVIHATSLPRAHCTLSFVSSARHVEILEGTAQQNLTWKYNGTDQYFIGVQWQTYIPRTSGQDPANLQVIWGLDKDGVQANNIPEQPSYKGRLNATKNGTVVSLIVKDVERNDSNIYVCNLIIFGVQDVRGPALTMVVLGPPQSPRILNKESILKKDRVTLRWSQPDNGGSPITLYTVTLKSSKVNDGLLRINLSDNSTSQYQLVLGWEEYYTVEIYAWNIYGRSVSGNGNIKVFHIQPAPPVTTISCLQKESFIIQVCDLNQTSPRTEEFQFRVDDKPMYSPAWLALVHTNKNGEWKCRARNMAGWGEWSDPVSSPYNCAKENVTCSLWFVVVGLLGGFVIILVMYIVVLHYYSNSSSGSKIKRTTSQNHAETYANELMPVSGSNITDNGIEDTRSDSSIACDETDLEFGSQEPQEKSSEDGAGGGSHPEHQYQSLKQVNDSLLNTSSPSKESGLSSTLSHHQEEDHVAAQGGSSVSNIHLRTRDGDEPAVQASSAHVYEPLHFEVAMQ